MMGGILCFRLSLVFYCKLLEIRRYFIKPGDYPIDDRRVSYISD